MSDEKLPTTSNQPDKKPQELIIDELRLEQYLNELRDNQNLGMGIVGGLVGAAAGALVWALVTYFTNYQIGWMAVGVGFLVGFLVRKLGRGLDTSFGIVGAFCSLLGCVAGNILSICIAIAYENGIEVMEVINSLNPDIIVEIMIESFHIMDVLFYGIAIYYGFKWAIYTLSEEELKRFVRPS